jgi:hypothetical protein
MVDFAEPNNPGALMVKVSFSHFLQLKETVSVLKNNQTTNVQ